MIKTILFPSSYFNSNKADEDLQDEYDAVKNTKLFHIILFGYEDWFYNNKLVLNNIPNEAITAVYRGWMMTPDQYEAFYMSLLENNIQLITSPREYRLFHIFPNIYPLLEEDTARILCFPKNISVNLEEVKKSFKQFMVKDYVKSVKGTDFPSYFENTITQDEFNSWMEVFYKYRGKLFAGGICIKEFLKLKKYNGKPNEYRVFYINNHVATINRNFGQTSLTTMPPQSLIDKYSKLPSKFYTVDYAELENGNWKIIEAGDGAVSGLSEY